MYNFAPTHLLSYSLPDTLDRNTAADTVIVTITSRHPTRAGEAPFPDTPPIPSFLVFAPIVIFIDYPAASAAGYPPQQTQYYPGGNGPYDQYPPPQTKMDGSSAVDFSQYQQPLQPQMYPPRYPPASSYQQMAPTYYEQPRGYPTASGPEARSYDPTQPAYGMPDPQVYMGYGKEPMGDPSKVPVSAPGIPAASYGYSKGFQPGYAGFYGNDPAAQFSSKHKLKPAEVAGRVEGGMEGGPMMPESKMDVFASSAFSQPLGLSFFPPPKSEEGDSADPNETKRKFGLNNGSYVAYGGGASYKPY